MAKGRYRIIRKIADGGMAEIFSGTQHGVEGFERPVVLKRILPTLLVEPQFKNLMIDEAHVAMSLSHSNIAQVLDLGHAKGSYYLVLELVDGWDLNNILNRLKSQPGFEMPPTLALFIVAEVCRALAYAHSRRRDGKPMGIVHRDVSPHNVLISVEGEVKLTDFGIAKAMVTKRENTVQGVIKGKLAFMSPEQASGAAIDARSDLFSLGTLLYLMFTGKRPFEAATDLESILRVQKADFPPPEVAKPSVPSEVAAIIKRAMQLRPSERYQSADGMLEAIEDVQRQVFGASGKTELKRWLSELETRDHVPSIGRLPAPPPGSPDETMELGDHDIQFEASAMAPLPSAAALGATLASPASTSRALPKPSPNDNDAIPEEVAFAPTSQTIPEKPLPARVNTPVADDAESQPPKSRRGVMAAMAFVVLGAGTVWAWRRQGRDEAPPTPAPPPPSPVAAAERPAQPPPPEAPPSPAPAQAEASPEPPAAEPEPAEPKDEDDEEALLLHAEPNIHDVVIGDDPEDAEAPPAPRKPQAAARKPTPAPKAAAPAKAAEPVVVSVKIVTKPPGAVIKLKKRVFGRAPMNLRFRAGQSYELHFVKQGYVPVTRRVNVTKRKNQSLTVVLRKKAPSKKKKNFIQRVFGL